MESFMNDNIYFNVEVNELFATIDITQTYINNTNNSIEMNIRLPNTDNHLVEFKARLNESKIIYSTVYETEKAKEKYSDSISSGNSGLICFKSEDEFYTFNIGNLNPNDSIELTTTYYQYISTYNKSYILKLYFDIPSFVDNNFQRVPGSTSNLNINSTILFNTFSEITSLNVENLKPEKYKKEFEPNNKKYIITYNEKEDKITSMDISFDVKNSIENKLFLQYDKKLNETTYFLTYKIPEKIIDDLLEKEKKINSPLYIFLLDQSGSMEGEPIELVKSSLKIFLHSLPTNSSFQLIGFGTEFEKYNSTPIIYSAENIQKMDEIISGFQSNKGGTEILPPLQDIFSSDDYSSFKCSKDLFLLTDGYVENTEKVLEEIEKNRKDFRIHSLGYGGDFDKKLIKEMGSYPQCTYNYVPNMTTINSIIVGVLEDSTFSKNISIKINSNQKSTLQLNDTINYCNVNSLLDYGFILEGDSALNITIDLNFKTASIEENKQLNFGANNIYKLEKGKILSKILVSNLLNNNNNINANINKLKLALKYQVVSSNTALFAEIQNSNSNMNNLIPLTEIKLGNNYILNNSKINILKRNRPKTGKHGHAKETVTYKDSKTGKIHETVNFKSPTNIEIKSKKKTEEKDSSEVIDLNLDEIALTQDLTDGFWYKNDKTDKIVDLVKDTFTKAEEVIKEKKLDDKIMMKILYTFIIIYYFENKARYKIKDFKLLIKKGRDFIKKNNLTYESIFDNLLK